jgi:hypothetical protein
MTTPQFAATSIDVTPAVGRPLGGYALRGDKPSTGTHDPLTADVLWLRSASGSDVVWVALDALAVDAELSAAIAGELSAVIRCDPSSIIVCASHTHSGPAGWTGVLHPAARTGVDRDLRAELVGRIVAGSSDLGVQLRPVEPLYFETNAPGIGANRNDPHGPHDDTLGLIAFVANDGRVAGAVFDHASHPTVLGEDNLEWSADWPGVAKRVLRSALASETPGPDGSGDAPIVGFLQGAAGDISSRFVRRAQSFTEVDRLGTLFAAHALRALSGGDPVVLTGADHVVRRATVRLATRSLPDPGSAEKTAAEMKQRWEGVRARGEAAAEERIALTRYQGAEIRAAMARGELPSELPVRLTALGIGRCAWIHLPVELFASLGLELRKGSPFEYTRVIGYTDDYLGYVADEGAHEDMVYEAMASVFGPRAGAHLIDAAIDLLERTKRARP